MIERICRQLELTPLINASATQTPLGGSVMNPRVAQAMAQASQHFFDIRAMHRAVGRRIAALTRNEDAMVSAGVASALYLLTMALVQREDPATFERTPEELPRGKSVILYKSHLVEYGCSIQQAGVSLRLIGHVGAESDPDAELLNREIEKNKPLFFLYVMAGLWIPKGAPSLDKVIQVCRRHGVPVVVDAAAQLPPKSNLWEITGAGADVVLFSGGKDLRSISHTGLILGNRDIVSRCRELISPTEGVGRFFKIGKEELAGMLVAVEDYVGADEAARLAWCEAEVDKIIRGLADMPDLTAIRTFPNEAGQPIPRVLVTYDRARYPVSPEELVEDFRSRRQPIAFLLCPQAGFYCNPMTLQTGESEIIVREIRDYFRER